MSGLDAILGAPARWFRHALQAPPQAVPDNLHGILSGSSRARLRTLCVALRRRAGPVLVLAGTQDAGGPPPGIALRDLDLRAGQPGGLAQQPAYHRLCEHAAGDLAGLVAACWSRLRDQDLAPGCYRALTLRAGARAVAPAQLAGALARHGLPAPIAHGDGLLCLVRALAELRLAATLGWHPAGALSAPVPPGAGREERERGLAVAFAAARAVRIPTLATALAAALADADPVHGPVAAGRIAAALHGAQPWSPWTAALSVLTATPADGERTAVVLAAALSEAQALMRRRDAAVRTLVIDDELLDGAAREEGQAIARGGRKVNCSCLVLSAAGAVPGWSDHAGFTVEELAGRLWLATDQDYRIDIDALVDAAALVSAHALLHRTHQAD